ncbi:MAG: acylphosphatase [Bacteroidales bacterium]|nr:acylphosphatase [Bacteroidales bacterium]
MIKAVSIKVTGHLKQVGYHSNILLATKDLNIVGKYQSNDDGSVYIEAQGDEKDLEVFINVCRRPSPFTRVDNLDVTPMEVNEELTSFEG